VGHPERSRSSGEVRDLSLNRPGAPAKLAAELEATPIIYFALSLA
jgi:hypothetical protein